MQDLIQDIIKAAKGCVHISSALVPSQAGDLEFKDKNHPQ
jgi:hypothetical protein